ncbi:MAG: respiratory chain complex I subunit 1 family protein [Planctomycetota bacterium]
MRDLVVNLLLLALLPPLLPGVINRVKARFAGRQGPPLLQPYFDIVKLMQKGLVLSTTTSWVFVAAPVVSLATALLAGLLVPLGSFDAPIAFSGDLILFVYLFALGRFFTTAAALDTGSPFEGMGAAREVTFACLSEAAVFCALLVLARLAATPNFSLTVLLHSPLHAAFTQSVAPLVLVAIGMFIVLLAENSRMPVDDPNTHLELTMIHEVMVLDHGGPLLGLIEYGAAMKLFVLSALFLHVVVPFQSGQPALDWLLFVAEMIALAAAIAVVESVMARLRMRHVPYLLVAAILFCGFGFVLLVR